MTYETRNPGTERPTCSESVGRWGSCRQPVYNGTDRCVSHQRQSESPADETPRWGMCANRWLEEAAERESEIIGIATQNAALLGGWNIAPEEMCRIETRAIGGGFIAIGDSPAFALLDEEAGQR